MSAKKITSKKEVVVKKKVSKEKQSVPKVEPPPPPIPAVEPPPPPIPAVEPPPPIVIISAVKNPEPEACMGAIETVTDTVEVQEEVYVELIPKFKEVVTKDNSAEQELIKTLREKLNNGTITDGEAAELFSMLSA